jgi:hypothetical protein
MTEFISGVACGAIVVDLTISTYSGRKKDRKTQDEVVAAKGSGSSKAASVYKSLFAECKELEAITKYGAVVRASHYRLTRPWTDMGSRILPTARLLEYCDVMTAHDTEFGKLVRAFLDKYDTLVSAAAFQLGTLFDRAEYPSRGNLAGKFGITRAEYPLPTGGDWRLDLDAERQQELVEKYQKRFETQLAAAQQENWQKLHAALTTFSVKLVDKEDENGKVKPQKLYESMIDGAQDLVGLLKDMNFGKDPALEKARQQLENAINGVTIADLRKSEGTRVLTKQKVDAVLSAFDWGDTEDEDADISEAVAAAAD